LGFCFGCCLVGCLFFWADCDFCCGAVTVDSFCCVVVGGELLVLLAGVAGGGGVFTEDELIAGQTGAGETDTGAGPA